METGLIHGIWGSALSDQRLCRIQHGTRLLSKHPSSMDRARTRLADRSTMANPVGTAKPSENPHDPPVGSWPSSSFAHHSPSRTLWHLRNPAPVKLQLQAYSTQPVSSALGTMRFARPTAISAPHPPRLLLVIPHIGAGLDEHCLFLPCWAWMMPACLMQMQHSDMGCALALLRHPASSSVTSYVRRQIAQRGGQNRGPPPPARRLLTSCV